MRRLGVAIAVALCIGGRCAAAPVVPELRAEAALTVVQTGTYRVLFARDTMDTTLELRAADGRWLPVTRSAGDLTFGLMRGLDLLQANGIRATMAVARTPAAIVIGRRAVLDPSRGVVLELHFVCAESGVLVGSRLLAGSGARDGILWSPPRLALVSGQWDAYTFWGADGRARRGELARLDPCPAYAGVSPWEQRGDVAPGLDARRPALVVRSRARGVGLGVVLLDYRASWRGGSTFLQRYAPGALYLYGGYAPADTEAVRWAWIAPFPADDPASEERRADVLLREGAALTAGFQPNAPAVPDAWVRPLPDFPAALRPRNPVRDINQAAVYTVNEGTAGSAHGLDLARKVGSDVLIRAWFKWGQAPPVSEWSAQPAAAHRMGALFGGGITCSALYDGENGLTREQLLDMATRGPDGELVDAWDTPGIRHGSLSSPAYLDYLFGWCREQIDAGADYLFMDEHHAALSDREGYDDHSLADFRRFLRESCPLTRGWPADSPRWRTELGIDLADPAVCPSGQMDTFDYRAHLRAVHAIANPAAPANRLFGLWGDFRRARDDRAWRALTDRIRAYARRRGRTVLISANGIAPYVDLQVVGVWDRWTTDGGHVDLRENLLPTWRSLVVRGRDAAGRRVPVVLFHDWGMGETPFPWMAVPPSEREVWMRTRAAEIYAAGGFFAFPVLGPFGCDAGRDGSLPVIARQTAFYRRHRDLYLRGRWLGSESLRADVPRVSLAAWWHPASRTLALHVVNRDVRAGVLRPRQAVAIRVPVGRAPRSAVAVSPDFDGTRPAVCRAAGPDLQVTVPGLEAYSVVLLRYDRAPELSRLADPVRILPDARWIRPARAEFAVRPGGMVDHASDLEGYLQGSLHAGMRNPPTFLVNAGPGVRLLIHVRAVATAGARLQMRLDGRAVKTIDLPDRDGRNDGAAREYARTYAVGIPPGRHRLTVDNIGGDWAAIEWYQFVGRIGAWR